MYPHRGERIRVVIDRLEIAKHVDHALRLTLCQPDVGSNGLHRAPHRSRGIGLLECLRQISVCRLRLALCRACVAAQRPGHDFRIVVGDGIVHGAFYTRQIARGEQPVDDLQAVVETRRRIDHRLACQRDGARCIARLTCVERVLRHLHAQADANELAADAQWFAVAKLSDGGDVGIPRGSIIAGCTGGVDQQQAKALQVGAQRNDLVGVTCGAGKILGVVRLVGVLGGFQCCAGQERAALLVLGLHMPGRVGRRPQGCNAPALLSELPVRAKTCSGTVEHAPGLRILPLRRQRIRQQQMERHHIRTLPNRLARQCDATAIRAALAGIVGLLRDAIGSTSQRQRLGVMRLGMQQRWRAQCACQRSRGQARGYHVQSPHAAAASTPPRRCCSLITSSSASCEITPRLTM
ncbi:hypothetical protein MMB19_25435 [Ralstonia insidiosa]|nr:hypothetical protein MMB19_25435 [Ralstonia insidiosa]